MHTLDIILIGDQGVEVIVAFCVFQTIFLHLQIKVQFRTVIPGLNIPSNLIVTPSCTAACPTIIGTQRGAVIVATATFDASLYGVGGNNVLQCGQGSCKAVAGPGNNVLLGSTSQTTDNNRLYGGAGNNIFIGGIGSTLMVGGKALRWNRA
ncbi:MAG: hypothetical protein WBZ36_11780 [Candidatus Nitrosopolaris sp.]